MAWPPACIPRMCLLSSSAPTLPLPSTSNTPKSRSICASEVSIPCLISPALHSCLVTTPSPPLSQSFMRSVTFFWLICVPISTSSGVSSRRCVSASSAASATLLAC
eukprot:6332212-Prymnesium_polylepis.1